MSANTTTSRDCRAAGSIHTTLDARAHRAGAPGGNAIWSRSYLRRMRERSVESAAVLHVLRTPRCAGATNDGAEGRIGNPVRHGRRPWVRLTSRRTASGALRPVTVHRTSRAPQRAIATGLAGLLLAGLAARAVADGAPVAPPPRPGTTPSVAPVPSAAAVTVRRNAPTAAVVGLGVAIAGLGVGGWILGRRSCRRLRAEGESRLDGFNRGEHAARSHFREVVVEGRERPVRAAQAFSEFRAGQGFDASRGREECEREIVDDTARRVRSSMWVHAAATAAAIVVAVLFTVWAV
jgi:hypothetical protein